MGLNGLGCFIWMTSDHFQSGLLPSIPELFQGNVMQLWAIKTQLIHQFIFNRYQDLGQPLVICAIKSLTNWFQYRHLVFKRSLIDFNYLWVPMVPGSSLLSERSKNTSRSHILLNLSNGNHFVICSLRSPSLLKFFCLGPFKNSCPDWNWQNIYASFTPIMR